MKTIGIVGLGVMGGSFAARLSSLGYSVIGFDVNPASLEYAIRQQWICKGYTNPKDGLQECSLLILCLYPTLLKDWLCKNKDAIAPGTLILEISGVKHPILEGLEEHIPGGCELLSIHPMCGRESRGISFATGEIFEKANFIIVPQHHNTSKAIEQTANLARDLGCKQVSMLSVEEHDDMIAFLSQLTHVIAVCLMNTHENEHLVEYTGDSFRDLTRIAKINEDMWSELFLLNKEKLLDEISQFEDSLDHFKKSLADEDSEEMKKLFMQSTLRRKKFDQ